MKTVIFCLLVVCSLLSFGCYKVSPDAADLQIEFTWEGMQPCGMGIPKIALKGVPENTKFVEVRMYDHAYLWDHGKVKIAYNGSDIIAKNLLDPIESPCPPDTPGRYKITVKALDENEVVIGAGSKERYYPEKTRN